jgi:hypothetical protein
MSGRSCSQRPTLAAQSERILVVFQIQCRPSQEFHFFCRRAQQGQHRLALQMNPWLSLIVEGTFQAAHVQVSTHGLMI